jgi:hypothetical protein
VPLCSGRRWRLLGLRALLERGGGQEAGLCKGELVGEEGDDACGHSHSWVAAGGRLRETKRVLVVLRRRRCGWEEEMKTMEMGLLG